jgi:hypothetical protein
MKTMPHKDVHLNSRTLQQPKWHSSQCYWIIDKINFQYLVLGIKFIPIPWNSK